MKKYLIPALLMACHISLANDDQKADEPTDFFVKSAASPASQKLQQEGAELEQKIKNRLDTTKNLTSKKKLALLQELWIVRASRHQIYIAEKEAAASEQKRPLLSDEAVKDVAIGTVGAIAIGGFWFLCYKSRL